MAGLDADVVGLQEVAFFDVDGAIHDQPLELARLTGRAVRYGAVHAFALIEPETGRSVGSATWGNAILTREPILHGFAVGLPIGLDDDLVEPADSGRPLAGVDFAAAPYGTREPRCAVGGRLPGSGGLSVTTTHLAYAGTEQRRAQATYLASLVDPIEGPVAVLGDFNAAIDAPELAPIAAVVEDAFIGAGVPVGDPRRMSCGPLAIDHILVRGFDVVGCRVERSAGDASDHLPVVADLRSADLG